MPGAMLGAYAVSICTDGEDGEDELTGSGPLPQSFPTTSEDIRLLGNAREETPRMTRQLAHHHNDPNPCVVCAALLTELAALRLALHNAEVDRDVAQMEAATLPHPRYTASAL